MKNKHKFKFKILLLLGASLAVIPPLFWISPNNWLNQNSTHIEAANFVEKNLNLIKDKFNKELSVPFNASSVEYRKFFPILEEENKYVSYIDFNDNNGYLILGDNLELFDISLNDDLKFLKSNNNNIFFSKENGFVYIEDEQIIPFDNNFSTNKQERFNSFLPNDYEATLKENKEMSEKSLKQENLSISSSFQVNRHRMELIFKDRNDYVPNSNETGHIPNKKFGPMYIIDDSKYVNKVHGRNFQLYDYYDLKGYWDYRIQSDFSVYKKNEKNYEGNCLLTSIYLTLLHLHNNNKINFNNLLNTDNKQEKPDYIVDINFDSAKEDKLKKYNKQNGWKPKNEKSVPLPLLYSKIRDIAIDYGYTYQTSPYTFLSLDSIINKVINNYSDTNMKNVFNTTKKGTSLNFERHFINPIKNNNPVIWNFWIPKQLPEAHSVVVTGYKRYAWKRKILWWTNYEFINLLKINDNHNEYATYFDISHNKYKNLFNIFNLDWNLGLAMYINK